MITSLVDPTKTYRGQITAAYPDGSFDVRVGQHRTGGADSWIVHVVAMFEVKNPALGPKYKVGDFVMLRIHADQRTGIILSKAVRSMFGT